MSDRQCRMTTKAGERCSRNAMPGSMGFCWQHVPASEGEDRSRWKERLKGAALVVSATEILVKIVELAVNYLPELFGSGEPNQTEAKNQLVEEFQAYWPASSDSYAPGSRVDWIGLLNLHQEAKRFQEATRTASSRKIEELEQSFDSWFSTMNDYHRKLLLKAIEEMSNGETFE